MGLRMKVNSGEKAVGDVYGTERGVGKEENKGGARMRRKGEVSELDEKREKERNFYLCPQCYHYHQ